MAKDKLPDTADLDTLNKLSTPELLERRNKWEQQHDDPQASFGRQAWILAQSLPFVFAGLKLGDMVGEKIDSTKFGETKMGSVASLAANLSIMVVGLIPLRLIAGRRRDILVTEARGQLDTIDSILERRMPPATARLEDLTSDDLAAYRHGMLTKAQNLGTHTATAIQPTPVGLASAVANSM